MGFFSWKTVDKEESISNRYSERGPKEVALLIPEEFGGGALIETDYEGYGKFGGRDAYALLAEWNDLEGYCGEEQKDRILGIQAFNEETWNEDAGRKKSGLKYKLKFVALEDYQQKDCKYEDYEGYSKRCEEQGYFYLNESDEWMIWID